MALFISEYQKCIFGKAVGKKSTLLRMSKALFISSNWALHLDKKHIHLQNDEVMKQTNEKRRDV